MASEQHRRGGGRSAATKGEQRREAIARAAERLFCMRGYYGASLRDIATAAEVNVGLINYYFPSKEKLLRHVVERRHEELQRIVDTSLRAAAAAHAPAPPPAGAVIRAFITPFFALLEAPESGWGHYVKLTSGMLSLYHVPELAESMASLASISELFAARLREALPAMDDSSFYAVVYVVEAVVSFIVQDPGFLDALTLNHHHSSDLGRLVEYLVPFLEGGAVALARRAVVR